MMTPFKYALPCMALFLFAFLPQVQAYEQEQTTAQDANAWQQEAHDDELDITVFTRTVGKSPLKEFKGVTHIKAPVEAFVALLEDTQRATEWMHNVTTFKVIESPSDVENVVYTVNATPWPVTDRDVYIRSVFSANEIGQVTSSIQLEPGFDKDDDYVRMSGIVGKWQFTPKENGMTEVVYQVHADPGGSLPNWLVNAIVVDTPLSTLENLHKVVHDAQYQNKQYDFIKQAMANK